MKYTTWFFSLLPTVAILFLFSVISSAGESYAWITTSGTATQEVRITLQVFNVLPAVPQEEPEPEPEDEPASVEPQEELEPEDEPASVEPQEELEPEDEPASVEPQEEPVPEESSSVEPQEGLREALSGFCGE